MHIMKRRDNKEGRRDRRRGREEEQQRGEGDKLEMPIYIHIIMYRRKEMRYTPHPHKTKQTCDTIISVPTVKPNGGHIGPMVVKDNHHLDKSPKLGLCCGAMADGTCPPMCGIHGDEL